MRNLDRILKSITLQTKVYIVKAMVFLAVMYRCESQTTKNAEHQRIDTCHLWCWRRQLSPLDCKEIKPVNPKGDQQQRDLSDNMEQFMLSRSVVSNSATPHGLQPARYPCPRGFSRQEYWSGLPGPPPMPFSQQPRYRNNLKCLSKHKRIKKMQDIYTMDYYSAVRRKDILHSQQCGWDLEHCAK